MEILIGKEPGQGRLLVSVSVNGKVKMAAMGGVGSVPRSVSRCFPAEGRAHCKIEVDSKGTMVITNLKPENVTYVDGMEIVAKKITGNSQVSLGKDKYAVDINAAVNIAKKLAGQEGSDEDNKEKKFFIQPLKKVWDTYHDEMFNLQKRQKNLGLIKSLYIPCTILSSGAGFLAKHVGLADSTAQAVSFVLYGGAAVILFYGLYRSFTDKSLEEKEQIGERFEHDYVCPNPECRHFLGYQKYDILRQSKNCPYCKCKWIEKP